MADAELIDVGAVLREIQQSQRALGRRVSEIEALLAMRRGSISTWGGDSERMTLTDEHQGNP